ncbi:PAS domain-containing protein, partial [Patescibacteria group bacterium]|nr:PAS domain-containing protein [Patescibacteria group bacterium]
MARFTFLFMTEKEKNSAVFPEKIRKFFRNRIQSIRLGAKIAFSPKKTNLEQIEKALPEYNLMKVFCETIPDAALLVKPDGEISFANKKFAARFDKDATEIIGKKIMELFSTEAAKKRMDKIQKAIEKKATVHFYDEWHDRILKNSVSPVINEKNDVIALAIVSHDITEY